MIIQFFWLTKHKCFPVIFFIHHDIGFLQSNIFNLENNRNLTVETLDISIFKLRFYFSFYFFFNFFNEKGWTTNESLRPLAYSTLADLVHHVRGHLPMADLARAVHLFSKNVHDESLPTSIQTMSCKLLLNLVEYIRQRTDVENGPGRDLLIEMLEVFVLKFKSIVKIQLPILMGKSNGQSSSNETASAAGPSQAPSSPSSLSWSNSNGTQASASPPSTDVKTEDTKSSLMLLDTSRDEKEKMMKFAARTPGPVCYLFICFPVFLFNEIAVVILSIW